VLHVRRPNPLEPDPPADLGEVAAGGVLGPQTSIAEKAFGEQYRKIALDEVDPSDPLINATLPG
jgi:hypothetical protein